MNIQVNSVSGKRKKTPKENKKTKHKTKKQQNKNMKQNKAKQQNTKDGNLSTIFKIQ
jgi:hypothetical protein